MFLTHVKTLPAEDIKVLIGDNLAAHLSPFVLKLCAKHNIRFCFLPENATHIMQPLDVTVFAPMKRHWRAILTSWKEECARMGNNYATLPKQVGASVQYVPIPVPRYLLFTRIYFPSGMIPPPHVPVCEITRYGYVYYRYSTVYVRYWYLWSYRTESIKTTGTCFYNKIFECRSFRLS